MKTLTAVLVVAGSLFAAQANAASYDFVFSDQVVTTLATSASSTNAVVAPVSPFYNFTLDTANGIQGLAAGVTRFTGVSIYNSGVLVGTDTITFSLATGATAAAAQTGAQTNAPVAGTRVLTATGGYGFEFDPAVFAVGNGANITFTPGGYVGEDTVHNSAASITVTPSAISAAPEPGAWALMLGGVAMLGAALRIRKARRDEDAVQDIATA